MKTSTKLLIIFFICIPVSLWAYNALLKKQLDAGNLTNEFRPDPEQIYSLKTLPPFKHLVVDGALTLGSGKNQVRATNWNPLFNIGDSGKKNTMNAVKVLRQYADMTKMEVRNDTLYISFHQNNVYKVEPFQQYNHYNIQLIKVRVTNLQSVNVSYATFAINSGVQGTKALKVTLDGKSTMNMYGLTLNRADVTVRDSSIATINGMHIDDLYYSLYNRGQLSIDINAAKHIYAGEVDSLSWMTVQGEAGKVKGFLNK